VTATGWRAQQAERTRAEILRVAFEVAAAEGLEALTVGRLATALGMSKSGLFAHFGSKEALQLATLELARERFVEAVGRGALSADEGLPRLQALCDGWLRYAADEASRGGCFFTAASAEFDGRPGPVRDRVAAILGEWLGALEGAIAGAQRLGHLDRKVDARQLAFELHALEMAADWATQLFGDREALGRARRGIDERLRAAAAIPVKHKKHTPRGQKRATVRR